MGNYKRKADIIHANIQKRDVFKKHSEDGGGEFDSGWESKCIVMAKDDNVAYSEFKEEVGDMMLATKEWLDLTRK